MKEIYRTLTFFGIAVVSVSLAVVTAKYSKPRPIDDFELVGEPFFPEFKEPAEARSLEVITVDKLTKQPRKFRVEYSDGLWRIPSHHNYPAEAKDRLAKTAASVIGIVRESLAGRRPGQHARFGVLDPAAETIEDAEGVGNRITLRKADGEVLADFIIGKRAEPEENAELNRRGLPEDDDEPVYYVRRPNEDETYRARLEIDLSTKFSDWIETNLLRVDPGAQFQQLTVMKHAFKEVKRRSGPFVEITSDRDPPRDQITRLSRDNFQWQIAGLDVKTEKVNSSNVSGIVDVLRDLKIAGVRPKPKYDGKSLITPDFQINVPAGGATRGLAQAIQDLQIDLQEKGFYLIPSETDPTRAEMFATTGQIDAATDEGIVYHLYFGEALAGDADEIEIGGTKPTAKKPKTKGDTKKAKKEPENTAEKAEKPDDVKNRFLYVRVEFDEQHLPEKPTPPVKPKKPNPYPLWAPLPKSAFTPADSKQGEQPKPRPKSRYERELEDYEAAMRTYQTDLKSHEDALKKYAENVEQKKAKVRELNERFADWYYVISSDSLANLHFTRAKLVSKKEPPGKSKAKKSPKPASGKKA